MAGNYMDAPSDRVAWDRDGSLLAAIISDGSISNLPASTMRILNAESGTGVAVPTNTSYLAVTFPIPMDISALFLASTQTSTDLTFQTSKDTTNGLDGTWSTQTTGTVQSTVTPQYRQLAMLKQMVPGALSVQVRGLRFSRTTTPAAGLSGFTFRAFHIYATPSSTATDARLVFWHPTLNEKLSPTYFDWSDVPRGSTEDRAFRIKNLSGSQTARQTAVFIESLTAATPPVEGMFTLSANGGSTFVTSLNLADLTPGALSPVLICRRTIPTNASVSVWTVRIVADVTTWS